MTAPQPIAAEKLDDSYNAKGPRFLDLREFVLVRLRLIDGKVPALESLRGPAAGALGVVVQGITSRKLN
jgi:hypothetical protein